MVKYKGFRGVHTLSLPATPYRFDITLKGLKPNEIRLLACPHLWKNGVFAIDKSYMCVIVISTFVE